MAEQLSKTYEPKNVEDKWYSSWLENGYFCADASSNKKAYSVVIPPPNVTGVLTMGHVLNNTLQDILCRRKRMQGFEVLWLPGTDHAGIATQTVVERTLKKEGAIKHRDDLGREKFIEKIWDWKHKHGSIIIQQLKKLGCSCDWEKEVFTMDGLDPANPHPRIDYPACVRKVFVDLYNKKMIYRGVKMVNWCPVSRTALSDEEVDMKEEAGQLWYFRYPIIDEKKLEKFSGEEIEDWSQLLTNQHVVVATTRPETMLGDEAIAVNPKDERYKNLVGKKILLPLKNRPIPVIADELVEKEFGTGAVKVTPAHDPADYEMGIRHNLPITTVIGPNGAMTAEAGEKFEGLDRFECRNAVVFDMEQAGLLEKVEPYNHSVGYSERADVPVEPMLSEQWFLKYPLVKTALKAVVDGDIKFWPDRWAKVYSHWLENIRDWCISRQLWWGHRIPAWYCRSGVTTPKSSGAESKGADCPPIVSETVPTKCPNCGGTELVQDSDVLDTWFSSWLWPFATMGWPKATQELKKFYPTTDLVTAPDIIFFWVARMIMAGFEYMGKRPFDNVYYTGIIRDSKGRKMSKSLGNSPDPLHLIERYGADGLRFGLMLIAPKGQDILFSEDRIEVGRNFMNKLWNASRFVFMNVEDDITRAVRNFRSDLLSLADKWIVNRMQHTIVEVNEALDEYQFDSASRSLYQFVWGAYCDWYLELSKTQLSSEDEDVKKSTQSILLTVLNNIVKLLHPFAPFITEEIWQKLNQGKGTIMYDKFPASPDNIDFEEEARDMDLLMEVIGVIRNIRGEHNIKPNKNISVTLVAHKKEISDSLKNNEKYIMDLAKVDDLKIEINVRPEGDGATAVAGSIEVFVPFAGLIDIGAEKERLAKEIAKAGSNVERIKTKLSNDKFVGNAPKEIIEKEKMKFEEADKELKKLTDALNKLS